MLHRTLRERGHDALLISFKRLYPSWLFPGQSDKDPSQEPLTTDNVHSWIDSLNPLSWLLTAMRLLRQRPDLVVISWWTTFLFPAWLVIATLTRVFSQVPLVFICHNVLPHEVHFWDPWIARLVLARGTGHIVQSDAEADRLRTLIPSTDPVVVPTPVFDMFSSELISKEDARAKLGLPLDVPILLFFGIVREYKGLLDLLEAVPLIRCYLDNVLLVIAGEFWESRESYEQKIRNLGIESSVVIHDLYIPNEDVPTYFGAADLVVAPHRRATGSGVVQMAIGFGVPLLTTLDSLFDDDEIPRCCLVVPSEDPPSVADAVVTFLSHPDAMGDAGIRKLQLRFSWTALVDACVNLAQLGDVC
jgi:glycosyltransferase involved in cell wall biosynthesis